MMPIRLERAQIPCWGVCRGGDVVFVVSLVVASYIYSMQSRHLHRRDAQCATRIHMLWSVLQ
jgi:hypothetical protein